MPISFVVKTISLNKSTIPFNNIVITYYVDTQKSETYDVLHQSSSEWPCCLNNHTPSKVWGEITYPFPYVNGCAVIYSLVMNKYFHPTQYN